ncbi:MAG: hypothetical protein LBV58_00465 [Acholeplasmatales bacterium]|jgi:hypothetical protein|nr:hypothetical protein [Acholeplasmatales bacterium]
MSDVILHKITKNVVYIYYEGGSAEKDIDLIVEKTNKVLEDFSTIIKIREEMVINYHLLETKQQYKMVVVDNQKIRSFALLLDVYQLYSSGGGIAHKEILAALSCDFGTSKSKLLINGLINLFLKPSSHISNEVYVSNLLRNGKFISIEELSDNRWFKDNDEIHNVIAGAFVGFLIKKYGLNSFKKIYINETLSNKEALEEELDLTINDIDRQFVRYLAHSVLV